MRRAITGRFDGPGHVLRFGVGGLAVAGLLFFGAYLFYPPENEYSFLEKSASYLGSFDQTRNPHGWWLFSLGLFVIGLVSMGATLFRHRHLARAVEPVFPLYFASGAFLVGSALFFALGAIPDARHFYVGPVNFNDIHDKLAAGSFWCLGIGMVSDGLILRGDRRDNGSTRIRHRAIAKPYLLFALVGGVGGACLLAWHIQCRLDPSLKEWPGHGIYSFPMWEWILTFGGPLTLVAVAWQLAKHPPRGPEDQGSA